MLPGRGAAALPSPGGRPRPVAFGGTLYNFWVMAAAAEYLMSLWDTGAWVAHCVSGGTVAGLSVACDVRPTALLEGLHAALDGADTRRAVDPSVLRAAFDRVLPADAHRRCRGRLVLYVIPVGGLEIRSVSAFPRRGDLLDACVSAMSLPGFNMTGTQSVGGVDAMDVATTLVPYTDVLRSADLFVALGPAAPRGAHVVVSPRPSTSLRPPTAREAANQVANARRALWAEHPRVVRGMAARGFALRRGGPRWPEAAPPASRQCLTASHTHRNMNRVSASGEPPGRATPPLEPARAP